MFVRRIVLMACLVDGRPSVRQQRQPASTERQRPSTDPSLETQPCRPTRPRRPARTASTATPRPSSEGATSSTQGAPPPSLCWPDADPFAPSPPHLPLPSRSLQQPLALAPCADRGARLQPPRLAQGVVVAPPVDARLHARRGRRGGGAPPAPAPRPRARAGGRDRGRRRAACAAVGAARARAGRGGGACRRAVVDRRWWREQAQEGPQPRLAPLGRARALGPRRGPLRAWLARAARVRATSARSGDAGRAQGARRV